MGKGSKDPTSTTTVSGPLAEYALPYYEDVMARASEASRRPYDYYPNQRLAQFAPEQEESLGIAAGIGRAGVPEAFRQATAKAAGVAGYEQDYTPTTFGVGSFTDPGVAAQYMNPFVENVIDVQRERAERRFQEEVIPGMEAQAVQAGAFGGSRAALQEGLARARLEEGLSDQEARLRAQAFEGARGIYGTEATRRLQEQRYADEAAQQAARLGIAGGELGLRSAQQLAALGGLEQQAGLRAAGVLEQVGAQRREEEQAMLDLPYSDFLRQRDYPKQQISYLSDILHGVPGAAGEERATYEQGPGLGQQLLGYGLGGLGLYRSIYGVG